MWLVYNYGMPEPFRYVDPVQPREKPAFAGYRLVLSPFAEEYLASHSQLFSELQVVLNPLTRPPADTGGGEGVIRFTDTGTAIKSYPRARNGRTINYLAVMSAMEEGLRRTKELDPQALDVRIPIPVGVVISENPGTDETEWYIAEQVPGHSSVHSKKLVQAVEAIRAKKDSRTKLIDEDLDTVWIYKGLNSFLGIPIAVAEKAVNNLTVVRQTIYDVYDQSTARAKMLFEQFGVSDPDFYPTFDRQVGLDVIVDFIKKDDDTYRFIYYITDPLLVAPAPRRTGN